MSCDFRLLLIYIFLCHCINQEVELSIEVHKFVYQKDMSAYCKRRVMPSVFLGRQVTDAYSQILHFSRLELPYSCFVSIRTESGSNIILVIQLMSDESSIESCRESKSQLLVYEIGETFGGYWGALPDTVLKQETPSDDYRYTLKTTPLSTTTTTESSTTPSSTTHSITHKKNAKSSPEPDYITVEVPLVNVSVRLVPGRMPASDNAFDPEFSFDVKYDVIPRPGMDYKTTVLPLMQFSMADPISPLRTDDEAGDSPRYQLEFNVDEFTPDSRLIFPMLGLSNKSKFHGKYKYDINKRLESKKNKKLLSEKEALFYRTSQPPYSKPLFWRYPSGKFKKRNETEQSPDSWEIVDAILKNLSKTTDKVPTMKVDKHVVDLLHGLAKVGYSDSVYLVPNTSWPTRRPMITAWRMATEYRTASITWRQPSVTYKTNYLDEVLETSVEGLSQDTDKSSNTMTAMNNNDSVINADGSGVLLPLVLDVDTVILNVTNQNKIEDSLLMAATEANVTSTTSTSTTQETANPMTLVDHESWENMVHAASQMAVVLNHSGSSSVADGEFGHNITTKPSKLRRKKRSIHAIPVSHAKPHRLPVKIEVHSSTVNIDKISDAQEFQRLIELQDDEIHDRMALRYLRHYVGPALFNICDSDETAARHVYLFNSSRLMLAISNFTMQTMTVVMTPARTLLTSEARCTSETIECQVSGARVCIDSLSACDGVPNCGSYDIYDEDRLRCGGTAGLQHNVCLAAVTFLAVLLTILYSVHYWLKRCVPRVSDAFFIYTDAAENSLILDTIMRSPYESEDSKELFRHGALPDYLEYTDMGIKKHTVGTIVSKFTQLFTRKKKLSREASLELYNMHSYERRLYSFGDLNDVGPAFTADAEVQTGPSLEMTEKFKINQRLTGNYNDSANEDILTEYGGRLPMDKRSSDDFEKVSNQTSDELSILKFFKQARTLSMQMSAMEVELAPIHSAFHDSEERQLQTFELNQIDDVRFPIVAPGSVTTPDAEMIVKKPEHVAKKLRFEEAKPIQEEEDSLEEYMVPEKQRRSVVFGSNLGLSDELEQKTDVNEPSTSTNREFKSYFWGGGKNKQKKSSTTTTTKKRLY